MIILKQTFSLERINNLSVACYTFPVKRNNKPSFIITPAGEEFDIKTSV